METSMTISIAIVISECFDFFEVSAQEFFFSIESAN